MKEYITLIDDANPYKNWKVLASLHGYIWVESLDDEVHKTANSTIFEFDLVTGNRNELNIFIESFQVTDLVPTEHYIYLSILCEEGNQLIQLNRITKEVKKILIFDRKCQAAYIHQVLQDSIILLKTMFEDNEGNIREQYELFKITEREIEIVYIDNEDMIDSELYITDSPKGPLLIIDKHVTPSDKYLSNGLADKITVYEL